MARNTLENRAFSVAQAQAPSQASQAPSDEDLCRQFVAGDSDAFELLLERHQDHAYRLACSIIRDPSEARDVAQEAFVRVYQGAKNFDHRSRFSTWFHRILINLCIDHQRKLRWWQTSLAPGPQTDTEPATAPLEQIATSEPGPDETAGRREELARLWAATQRMPARRRAVLMLHLREDLSSAEIAEIMGCTKSTVRVQLFRAISELKKTLAVK